jgi:hypothetical protein
MRVAEESTASAGGLPESVSTLLHSGDFGAAVRRLGEELRECDDPELRLLYGQLAHFGCDFETARRAGSYGRAASAASAANSLRKTRCTSRIPSMLAPSLPDLAFFVMAVPSFAVFLPDVVTGVRPRHGMFRIG